MAGLGDAAAPRLLLSTRTREPHKVARREEAIQMKSSTNLNRFTRFVVLSAVVAAGAFAATAGATGRPPDIQDVAATAQASNVSRPPDVSDVATRLSVSTPDVFERYAAAHPFGAGLSLSDVSRPPDVGDVASHLSTATPDVFERYAA